MVKLKPKKQIDVYDEVWRKYSSLIMNGKLEPPPGFEPGTFSLQG
jgi:hypothetical protein